MRRRLALGFLIMTAIAGLSYADTQWLTADEVEEKTGRKIPDVTGPRGYWAGSVEEVEVNVSDDGSVKTTGRIKVRITWVTDRTDYECHGIYIMYADEVEDFTHRSLALRRCR